MTHAYFLFYHTIANLCIRRARHAVASKGRLATNLVTGIVVFILSYATAYMETLTIAHFPYYTFKVGPLILDNIWCPLVAFIQHRNLTQDVH